MFGIADLRSSGPELITEAVSIDRKAKTTCYPTSMTTTTTLSMRLWQYLSESLQFEQDNGQNVTNSVSKKFPLSYY